ncbi:MAG: hypothetical protein ACP5N3_04170 [Candidatus Nanoarchaeia archaeon]
MYEEKQRLLYNTGLPFGASVAFTLDKLNERVRILNKGAMIIIDGSIGSGKTIAGVNVADYLNGAYEKQDDGTYKQIPENFIDSKIQFSMGAQDFMKKLVACYKLQKHVIIYDEAGQMNKRSSLTKLNNDLNRIFEMCRSLQIVIILILPNFFYIDRSVIDKEMIRTLFRITRRSQTYADAKVWGVDGINWLKYYSVKYPIASQCYSYVRPFYKTNFLPLSKERMTEYKNLTDKMKIKTIDDISGTADNKSFITVREIVEIYGVSNVTFYKFAENFGLKPKKIGNRTFYDADKIKSLYEKYGISSVKKDKIKYKRI